MAHSHVALLLAICACACAHAYSVGTKEKRRVLVLIDDAATERTHAKLLAYLRARNLELDVRTAETTALSLRSDGAYWFDGVMLLCPKTRDLKGRFPVADLADFMDAGRDVFVAADTGFSDYTRSAARLVGVDLAHANGRVVDHHNNARDGWVYAGGRAGSKRLFGDVRADEKIAFRGPGATLFSDNELVDSVVWGAGSSYTAKNYDEPLREAARAIGSQNVLGATLSTRAQSRGVYWGSIDALSDAAVEKFGDAQMHALFSLVAWTFGNQGVLQVVNTRHYRIEPEGDEREYRVKDRLAFEMDVLEWDGAHNAYKAFSANDVQLEFTMLNPWVRTRFVDMRNGTLRAVVQVPDQIGVYKFVVEHWRAGLSPLSFQKIVPIRPFLHNEYARFLTQALPYYVTSFVMIIGVLLLGVVLLYADVPVADGQSGVQSDGAVTVVESDNKPRNLRRRNAS